jgi:Ni/Co efflux regulator RcnB
MKRIVTAAAVAVLGLSSFSGAALAQPHEHHDNGNHYGQMRHEWRRGDRIDRREWAHYQRVDWRRHHLRPPPRGYEWREANGQYVLAAAATGLIASIIAASH